MAAAGTDGGQGPPGGPGGGLELLRRHQAGLGPLDVPGQVGQRHPRQDGPARRQGASSRALRSSRAGGRLAAIRPPPMQLGRRQGVERPGADLLAQAELAKPVLELAGGLAGEGQGQRVAGVGRCRCGPGRRSGGSAPGSCPRRPMPGGTAGAASEVTAARWAGVSPASRSSTSEHPHPHGTL